MAFTFIADSFHNIATSQTAQYPPSPVITGVTFNFTTLDERAYGSDNFPITWADDDHQYTTWGDGGGFGGTDDSGRVSLGFARVEGPKNNYQGINVWGGYNPENPAQFTGKSYGLISIEGEMWMWRTGDASGASAYDFQELYKSTDHSATWIYQGVNFTKQEDFNNSYPLFYAVTFCQFGKDYNNARDDYIYMYAPEVYADNGFNVQYPGHISLMRVHKSELAIKAAYEFFAGMDQNESPLWTSNLLSRKPVFEDSANGVRLTSVSFNEGLGRYFLITQHVSKQENENGHIGIYDAPEPWGPWTTVLFENAWTLGLHNWRKTVYWNFSNKWLSSDGKDFVLVYTGKRDNWGTVEGSFIINNNPQIFASIRIFLEGAYDPSGDSMRTDINANLPLAHPYSDPPWNYQPYSVSSIPDSIVDWVMVAIRSDTFSSSAVDTTVGFLTRSGMIVDTSGSGPIKFNAQPADYFIVVYHRNHLPVMSAVKHPLSF